MSADNIIGIVFVFALLAVAIASLRPATKKKPDDPQPGLWHPWYVFSPLEGGAAYAAWCERCGEPILSDEEVAPGEKTLHRAWCIPLTDAEHFKGDAAGPSQAAPNTATPRAATSCGTRPRTAAPWRHGGRKAPSAPADGEAAAAIDALQRIVATLDECELALSEFERLVREAATELGCECDSGAIVPAIRALRASALGGMPK